MELNNDMAQGEGKFRKVCDHRSMSKEDCLYYVTMTGFNKFIVPKTSTADRKKNTQMPHKLGR